MLRNRKCTSTKLNCAKNKSFLFGMANLEELLADMQKQSNMTAEQLNSLIEDKSIELSGMINKEAAIHLVAQDLGINLPKSENNKLQIKNLVPGMRNVNIIGRVFKTSPIKEFQKKNGEKGKVSNIFISDGTGYTRVPMWNDQVKIVEDELIKAGDAVQIFGGMSKENIYGEVEISVGKFGGIRKIEDEYLVPSLESIGKNYFSEESQQVKIAELVPGNFDIRGTIVKVFRGNFLFETDSGEKALVISCLTDDGTADIRTVFFREQAEKISGLKAKDLEGMEPDARLDVVARNITGREIIISGKAKKNNFFDNLEMIVDSIKDINPVEESKRIVEALEAKIGV